MTENKKDEKAPRRTYEEEIMKRAEARSVSLRDRFLKESTEETKPLLREKVALVKEEDKKKSQ